MGAQAKVENLEGVLTEICRAGDDPKHVSIGDMQERLGARSFGPLLLVAGLPSLTPIATVPGLPTVLAIVILLTAGQLFLGMRQVWLPDRIRRRAVRRDRVERVVRFLRPAARFVDRLIRPRLVGLTRAPATHAIAVGCCLLALTMPPLEFIPFTGGIPALPVAAFGLALVARDGLLVIVGFALIVVAAAATVAVATLV